MSGYHKVREGLYLIDLDLERPGFQQFISSWVIKFNGLTFIVDPGPVATFYTLTAALSDLGIERIDYVLLTHIHIDHAGATGLLIKNFPEAEVICHPGAISHLIEPDKLWESSLRVLGDLALDYGPISPVNPASLHPITALSEKGLPVHVIETPGHSPHHVCYQAGEILFIGEAAGISIPTSNGAYQRVATPPVFKYDIFRDSLLKAAELKTNLLCFGHYGYRSDTKVVFQSALKQLDLWMKIIEHFYPEQSPDIEELIFREILEIDPALESFNDFTPDIQYRERYFCMNSIRGMLGYVKKREEGHSISASHSSAKPISVDMKLP